MSSELSTVCDLGVRPVSCQVTACTHCLVASGGLVLSQVLSSVGCGRRLATTPLSATLQHTPNCLPSWAHLSFGSQPFRSRIPLYCFLFFCKTDLLSVIICYLQVWPLLPAPVFRCLPPGQAALYTNTHTTIISDYRLSWLKTSVAPGQDKLSVCTHVVFAQPAGRRSESTKGKRCAKYSHDPARLRHRSQVTSGNAAPHGKVHQPCKCKVHQPCECKAGSLTTYVH